MEKKIEDIEYIDNFADLVVMAVDRLRKGWKKGEADYGFEIRTDNGKTRAKIKGGETDRIG